MNLVALLQDQFRPALAAVVADPGPYLGMIRPAQDAKVADYQANFAMALAKSLGKKPQELARELVERLDLGDALEPPQVAGPGFINLRFRADWLAARASELVADERLGVAPAAAPRHYVVEYSSPNVAKPLHVGHLRSTIIGEALKRILRALGHKVTADNHLGDWGTQFGMLIYGYKNFLDRAAYDADPVRELLRLYVLVRKMTKEGGEDNAVNSPAAQAARAETAKLHEGDPDNLAIWQQFMPACLAEIQTIYDRLGVSFDSTLGESFYNPMLVQVLEDLEEQGLIEQSQGALIYTHEDDKAKPDDQRKRVAVIRKSDGAFTYTTTDLATVQYRASEWNPDVCLYVVDSRQADHFAMVFQIAKRWGFDQQELVHVPFGTVLGEDGKPLKARDGTAVELEDLLDDAVANGLRKYEELRAKRVADDEEIPALAPDEVRGIAEAVGLGAVKYADLSQNRTSDYKYDPVRMLATDGNTATYMQYAYVRCRGIFRKGDVDVEALRRGTPSVPADHPAERALALQLLRFEEALTVAARDYSPHMVTAYLWDLAKAYSGFFNDCPVLKAASAELRNGRLALCDLTARTIHSALDLLGIRTPERM